MVAVIGFLLALSILLPLAFIWRLWRLDEPTRLGWLLALAETAVLLSLIGLLNRWDIAGFWTRAALAVLAAVATLVPLLRHRHRPWLSPDRGVLARSLVPMVVPLVVFGAALAYVAWGMGARHDPRALSFPLSGGRFVVAQGGGIGVLNHHSDHPAQRHALDITAVGDAGFRAYGLLPKNPADYAIFGKTVVSPCAGEVIAAVDGLPDLSPPEVDRDNPAGNHVIIACDGMRVELAHLRQGSVTAAVGARVSAGAPIGTVGNSGNSTEPHLHIHAVDAGSGMGVQLSFDGRIPGRNAQFVR
ncbi:M23 family metallopeptidase [Ensifer adhaerens]|uniref:M23 family metallopeptidase n=1 Tax=Ensifer adhaerens TaxID=106592 RepID=UPI00098F3041|nr:M23 family metallopeptidase [Ensifer adhaerens]